MCKKGILCSSIDAWQVHDFVGESGSRKMSSRAFWISEPDTLPANEVFYLFLFYFKRTGELVFESLVRSGFLMPKGFNCNHNWSSLFSEVKKTKPDCKKTTDHGILQSLDWSWSAPVVTSLWPVFRPIFCNYESVTLSTFLLALKWAQEC